MRKIAFMGQAGTYLTDALPAEAATELPVSQPIDLELPVRDRVLVDTRLCAVGAAKRRRQLALEHADEGVAHRLAAMIRIAEVDQPSQSERVDVRGRHDGYVAGREPEGARHRVVWLGASLEHFAVPVQVDVGITVDRELLLLAHGAAPKLIEPRAR